MIERSCLRARRRACDRRERGGPCESGPRRRRHPRRIRSRDFPLQNIRAARASIDRRATPGVRAETSFEDKPDSTSRRESVPFHQRAENSKMRSLPPLTG